MIRLRKVRVITPRGDIYVDRTVIGLCYREGRAPKILKETIHGTYKCVGALSDEAIQDGAVPPRHSKVYVDPASWMYYYLRRVS